MSLLRSLGLAVMVLLAVVLQSAVLAPFSVYGVVPDLVLIIVVAAALVRGPEFGATTGFLAGLLTDLAPPADHALGRWALAFVVVGFLAGRLRYEASSRIASVGIVGASSFVATSVFALSGLALHDEVLPVGDMVTVIVISVVFDLLVAPLFLPPLMRAIRWLRSPRAALG